MQNLVRGPWGVGEAASQPVWYARGHVLGLAGEEELVRGLGVLVERFFDR